MNTELNSGAGGTVQIPPIALNPDPVSEYRQLSKSYLRSISMMANACASRPLEDAETTEDLRALALFVSDMLAWVECQDIRSAESPQRK